MASANATVKDERVAARLTGDQKAAIERAAGLRGVSVSDFMVGASMAAAVDTIEEAHLLRLTVEESVRFMEALEAPPRRLDALREAHRRRRELVVD